MSSNKKLCPVPFDQQPLNEYESLKKSLFFSWSTESPQKFSSRLMIIFLSISCISISLNVIIFSVSKISFHTILNSLSFGCSILEILLIRLYLGWSYVLKRLSSATIFYEESGWYDGQLWIKSADLLTQDRLVGIYQVEPLIVKIKNLFGFNSALLLLFLLLIEIL